MASLIQIARISEDLAYQANAAKLLAPFAPEASAQHLNNAKTLYAQLGEALLAGAPEKKAG
jgi:hypothetical protein